MSGWNASYIIAGDLIAERLREGERSRLARRAAAGPSAPGPDRGSRTYGQGGSPGAVAAGEGESRRWTLRLARLAVTVSLDSAAQRGAGS
jgi:hypothetical protein